MTLTALAFYVFASVAVASGLFVILARNPVHSVLWLILSFFSAAGLMVLLGAEFVAMLLVIVYVGAVAVLFLFVVMMLDVDFTELRQGLADYLPLGALIGLWLRPGNKWTSSLMSFGAGALLAALTLELVAKSLHKVGWIGRAHV